MKLGLEKREGERPDLLCWELQRELGHPASVVRPTALKNRGVRRSSRRGRGAFCFVQGDIPLLRTPSIDGYELPHRRSLPERLNADGPLTVDGIVTIAEELARAFPRRERLPSRLASLLREVRAIRAPTAPPKRGARAIWRRAPASRRLLR